MLVKLSTTENLIDLKVIIPHCQGPVKRFSRLEWTEKSYFTFHKPDLFKFVNDIDCTFQVFSDFDRFMKLTKLIDTNIMIIEFYNIDKHGIDNNIAGTKYFIRIKLDSFIDTIQKIESLQVFKARFKHINEKLGVGKLDLQCSLKDKDFSKREKRAFIKILSHGYLINNIVTKLFNDGNKHFYFCRYDKDNQYMGNGGLICRNEKKTVTKWTDKEKKEYKSIEVTKVYFSIHT